MPEEERRISPAVAIIPVGLGLGLVGVLAALAWAAPPTPPSGLIGDLNDDGAVDYDDLAILQNYIAGIPISEISPLSEAEFLQRADVNEDGVVNALDISALEALITEPEPLPELIGSIGPGFIWYEGLAGWEWAIPGREIALNEEIHLAPGWSNKSEINIVGHVDLSVTYPNGTERTLSAVLNQDEEAAPGDGYYVNFEPFISSQEGTYTVTATLSSAGQVLDSVTFTLEALATPQVGWILPTGHIDPDDKWIYEERAYDDNLSTFTSTVGYHYYGEPLELTLDSPVYCDKVRINAASYWTHAYRNPDLSIDIHYDGGWHNIWSGRVTKQAWVEIPIPAGIKLVDKARVKWNEDVAKYLYEFNFWSEG